METLQQLKERFIKILNDYSCVHNYEQRVQMRNELINLKSKIHQKEKFGYK